MQPMTRSLALLAPLLACLWVGGVAWAASNNKRPSDGERGRELWQRHCRSCHGVIGAGDGPATRDLVQPVPDLLEVLRTEADVRRLQHVVLNGRGRMPGYAMSFDEYDARRVLRHARAVQVARAKDDASDALKIADPEAYDAERTAARRAARQPGGQAPEADSASRGTDAPDTDPPDSDPPDSDADREAGP